MQKSPVSTAGGWQREANAWLLAVALTLPAGLPYLAHYLLVNEGAPTGFIQLDEPTYLANAREHFDNGAFQLTYGNPHSPRYETRPIYFQPQTLALGLALKATGWPPGLVFALFGLLAATTCVRVMISLYRAAAGETARRSLLGLLLFAWGGGVLALTGYAHAALKLPTVSFENFLDFDPFGGWWFLNLGRNLVMPLEAYYHALFLGAVLCVLHARYRVALLLAALTSLSHPFTGIELGLVLATWSVLERWYIGNNDVPRRFLIACLGLVVAHLFYYLWYLNTVAEHRVLSQQWALPWTLDLHAMLPAYAIVGALAAWRIRNLEHARRFLGDPSRRLLLLWFAIAFTLANHEILTRPVQPLHFTRGYIWTPLFLLGAEALINAFRTLRLRLGAIPGTVAIGLFAALFLFDNAIWLASFPIQAARGKPINDVRLSSQQQALFDWMNQESTGKPRQLVICRDGYLSYLMGTYTPHRAWRSHGDNTPHPERRGQELAAFFKSGDWQPFWSRQPVLIVLDNRDPEPPEAAAQARGGFVVYHSDKYRVYHVPPRTGSLARTPGASKTR